MPFLAKNEILVILNPYILKIKSSNQSNDTLVDTLYCILSIKINVDTSFIAYLSYGPLKTLFLPKIQSATIENVEK